MSLLRGRMFVKHNLKCSTSVWSRDLFLRFIVFTAEKPASHKYDVEKGIRAAIASFVMMGYSCRVDNQNEAVCIDECYSFSLLSFLISVSSSYSATVSSADSDALNTIISLIKSEEDTSSDAKHFSVFLLSNDKRWRIKCTQAFVQSTTFVSSNISILSSYLIVAPYSISFP
jgi:hypothetical protein